MKASLKSVSRAPILGERLLDSPPGPPHHPLLVQVVEAYTGRDSREATHCAREGSVVFPKVTEPVSDSPEDRIHVCFMSVSPVLRTELGIQQICHKYLLNKINKQTKDGGVPVSGGGGQ